MLTFEEFFNSGDIVNLTEQVVYDELNSLIERKDLEFCQCDKCLFDIACVVLNAVPSLYSSSDVDRKYPNADFAMEYESLQRLVKEELPKSIELVKSRLHH